MKILKWFLILAIVPMMVGCLNNEPIDDTHQSPNITIESGIDSVYNIYKGDTLVIEPVIKQSNEQKPLTYTWEVNLSEYTYDETFTFAGTTPGRYSCKLIVEDDEGKCSFPFTVNVCSLYDEGLLVLSKDNSGNSMLSFVEKSVDEGEITLKKSDCFAANNYDTPFASGAADIVECGEYIIVACQGGGVRGDKPTMYYLDKRSFLVKEMFAIPEYDDFKPVVLGIPHMYPELAVCPIVCENGKVYDFTINEVVVAQPSKLKSTYASNCIVDSNNGSNYTILLWDNEKKALVQIYNGYGPFYCSEEYLSNYNNYFSGSDLVTMAKIQMTQSQKNMSGNLQEFLIITRKNQIIVRSEVLYTDLWVYDFETQKNTLPVKNASQGVLLDSPIGVNTPMVANKTYQSLIFADGNKVRCWNYNTKISNLAKAETLLTVGSENAVITSFEISGDHQRIYVAFYEPDSSEALNGSVWVFDTATGEVLERYDNMCYQPIKIIYKTM